MKLRRLTLAVALMAGGLIIDTSTTFAAQKEPRCRQKDTLLLATTLEQQRADWDKDGWVCQRPRARASVPARRVLGRVP